MCRATWRESVTSTIWPDMSQLGVAATRRSRVARSPRRTADREPASRAWETVAPRAPRVRAVPAVVARPGERRHQAVPLPRPGQLPRPRAVPLGPRTSASARCRTSRSATCSRWGRSSGSSTRSACRCGSRSASGSAPSCSSPRSALGGCSAKLGIGRVGRAGGRARLHAHAVPARVQRPHLGDPARVGRPPWLVGLAMRATRRRRVARPGALRAHGPSRRRR